MKKIKLHYLFLLTGLILLIISCFVLEKIAFGLSWTYYVFDAKQFGIAIFLQYTLYTLAYYSICKNSNKTLTILNLFFITLPIVYFMFPDIIYNNVDPKSYLEHPFLLDLEVFLPPFLWTLFLIGHSLFVLNLIISLLKKKSLAST